MNKRKGEKRKVGKEEMTNGKGERRGRERKRKVKKEEGWKK